MSPPTRALVAVVGFYRRAISPVLGPRCRFAPTCSEYALEAVQVHGAARGSWLAVVRIAKCAPWHSGGVDLVPGTERAPEDPPADPGTGQHVHSSDTGADSATAYRPSRVPLPPRGRTVPSALPPVPTLASALPPVPTLQQEAGVA